MFFAAAEIIDKGYEKLSSLDEYYFFHYWFVAPHTVDSGMGSSDRRMASAHVALDSRAHCGVVTRRMGDATHKTLMLVSVKVFPDASRDEIIERGDARFEIFVRAAPKDGAATRATARLLAAHFGVPEGALRLIRGARERNKIFEIAKSRPF